MAGHEGRAGRGSAGALACALKPPNYLVGSIILHLGRERRDWTNADIGLSCVWVSLRVASRGTGCTHRVASGTELNTKLGPLLIPTMATDDGTHGHLHGHERPALHTTLSSYEGIQTADADGRAPSLAARDESAGDEGLTSGAQRDAEVAEQPQRSERRYRRAQGAQHGIWKAVAAWSRNAASASRVGRRVD